MMFPSYREKIVDDFKDGPDIREGEIHDLTFCHYLAAPAVKLRAYLHEKTQIGLISYVELHAVKGPLRKTPLRLCLVGTSLKLWEDVLKPGIEEFMSIQSVDSQETNIMLVLEEWDGPK